MSGLLSNIAQRKKERRSLEAQRSLLQFEARLGGQLFGTVPKGNRREFFCLDERTWVWHEEWHDKQGQHHAATTRYDVRPTGILKSQGAHSYQRLTISEERNFRHAVNLYCERIQAELLRIQHQAHASGH